MIKIAKFKPSKPRKTIFFKKIKSKRRADIVSITSPDTFRKSIAELRKGRYTVADQRALILAQNRARAMLNRKDLSMKERRQMREIADIKVPKAK